MKSSNKILLGFLILVFATLVFLFMGFRNKIKKGEFTVMKTPTSNSHRYTTIRSGGSIKPFKIVKIVGPGMDYTFFCNIIPSSSATCNYTNSKQDSINLQQKGDTLLITYLVIPFIINGHSITNIYTPIWVDLYLPFIKNVIVEGADVTIDSVNTIANPEIYFDLRKKATLTLGKNGTATTLSPNLTGKNVPNKLNKSITTPFTVIEKSSGQFNKLIIKTSDSFVNFETLAWVSDLNLQMQGLSKITIDDKSRIYQLKGFISDSTKVDANWKNIRRLALLTNK